MKHARDRYANIEATYLLQQTEAQEGLVFVTINLRQNFDSAFKTRPENS